MSAVASSPIAAEDNVALACSPSAEVNSLPVRWLANTAASSCGPSAYYDGESVGGPDRSRGHSLRRRGRDDRSLWAPRRAVELGEQDLQNIVIERGRQGCTEVDRGGHFAA